MRRNSFSHSLLLSSVFLLFHTLIFSQRVGIGTESPTEALEIAGNIRVDSAKLNAMVLPLNAGNGKVLTSDATGNASWQMLSTPPPPPTENNGNIGYGVWGDCATNGNISFYQPVADTLPAYSERFGQSVSISGNFAVVGAEQDAEFMLGGSATVYQLSNGKWTWMQKLSDSNPQNGDLFGYSVSISGNYIVIGAPGDDETFSEQGSASVFFFNGISWVLQQKITDADAQDNDLFGSSVCISGLHLVIGAPNDDVSVTDQGSASFYAFDGSVWNFVNKVSGENETFAFFGSSTSLYADRAIIGIPGDNVNNASNIGSVSFYQFDGTTWNFTQNLTDLTFSTNQELGFAVSMYGNYAIAGAPRYNGQQGAIVVFLYAGNSWGSNQIIIQQGGSSSEFFGWSVSLSGNYLLVGIREDVVDGLQDVGSAMVYVRLGLGWQPLQHIIDPAHLVGNRFGTAVSLDSVTKRFMIGAPDFTIGAGKVVFGKIN